MIRRLFPCLLLLLAPLYSCILLAQLELLGAISGQLRVAPGGDSPSHQIMVELQLHGPTIYTVYSDAQGRFGFNNLPGNTYHVVINDAEYYPVDESVILRPENPNFYLHIVLRRREQPKKEDSVRASGSNPYLVGPADYNKKFPKKAVKEYERGLEAEHKGQTGEAIAHYVGSLKIAPDYYPAHNNLGSLYLSNKDFPSAEEQFREAIRLDQNEAQGYFNLGNVLLLTGRYGESEKVLQSGLQRRPDSAFGHFLEGCLLERVRKFPEAEKSLHEALELDPTMSQAHLQLVSLYLQQNRRQDAINQLQTFLKAFPDAAMAPRAKELLQKLRTSESPKQ
jgi:tetratricopeptide (TPR) repeat protein